MTNACMCAEQSVGVWGWQCLMIFSILNIVGSFLGEPCNHGVSAGGSQDKTCEVKMNKDTEACIEPSLLSTEM